MAPKLGYDIPRRVMTNGCDKKSCIKDCGSTHPLSVWGVPTVTRCDEKLYHWLRNNPPFYPFRMSLPWCAFLATDLCKAQRTTRCKTEPDSSKPLGKKIYGEPKGEDSFEGSWSRTCESRLIRMSQNGTEARLWHSMLCYDEWTYGLPVLRILLSV
jgi:hypothetical protein